MYRINVLTSGKRSNVTLGCRYSLRKKPMLDFANLLDSVECKFNFEKLIYLCNGIWCWSREDRD